MISFSLSQGSLVSYAGDTYEIVNARNTLEVLARNIVTKKLDRLPISQLRAVAETSATARPLESFSEKERAVAQHRFATIKPLLDLPARSREEVERVASAADVSINTVYKWLRGFHEAGSMIGLLPATRGRKRGTYRLEKDVEAIVADTLNEFYLTKQQHSARKTYEEVCLRVRGLGLEPPHRNTIYNRIRTLSHREKLSARSRRKEANDRYTPRPGTFEAQRPLQVVQMDHHKLDIVLVDRQFRMPIGRPWLTLAIDVYSRMIVGYYVSLDPPGAVSTGLCLSNSILPKEAFLLHLGVDAKWNCWGLPATIHVDNAKEFHGKMLEQACLQYNIVIEYRPVMVPHYGGHVERVFRTLSNELKSVRGTTFSSIPERAEYDSDAQAALTIEEIEAWIATYITGVYHQTLHAALDKSPAQKYEEAFTGSATRPAIPLPNRIVDEERLVLDFLPCDERKVEHYGIQFNHVRYWSDELRPYVLNAGRSRQKYTIRYDPRDLSKIYFLDPELNRYVVVPYRDISQPSISLWELREVKRQRRAESSERIDEKLIFESLAKMKNVEAVAVKDTKKKRLARERQRRNDGVGAHVKQMPSISSFSSDHEILPSFDDLELQ